MVFGRYYFGRSSKLSGAFSFMPKELKANQFDKHSQFLSVFKRNSQASSTLRNYSFVSLTGYKVQALGAS